MKTNQIWIFLVIMLSLTLIANIIQSARAFPEDFEQSFAGTGLVEKVDTDGNRCEVKLALYDWLNLSNNYPKTAIPSRNDRFLVVGEEAACNAITVAQASTGNHLAFNIGLHKGKWYFSEAPLPGTGCGGLSLDWKPEPEVL